MDADTERAIRSAFQCYVDACLEHDCEHAQRAAQRLRELIPEPRIATGLPRPEADGCTSQMNAAHQ